MAGWNGSDRRQRLPADWERRRTRVLRNDGYRCTWRNVYDERCIEPATDVDHIRPGDDHSDANLRSLCSWHHDKKSAHEGGLANARKRAGYAKRFKREEKHPGLI